MKPKPEPEKKGSANPIGAGLKLMSALGLSNMQSPFDAMFLVMLFLFNAWRQMIIIRLVVPLTFVGVIYCLAGAQTPLRFMAFLEGFP